MEGLPSCFIGIATAVLGSKDSSVKEVLVKSKSSFTRERVKAPEEDEEARES